MGSTGGLQRRAGGSIGAWWGSPSPPRTEQRRNWCGWEGSRSNPSWRAGRPASALHVAPGCKAGRKGRCQPPAHEELGETEGWMLLTASCRAARGASQQPPRWRDLTPSECQRPAALGACPGGGPHTPSPPWHGSNHAQEPPAPWHNPMAQPQRWMGTLQRGAKGAAPPPSTLARFGGGARGRPAPALPAALGSEASRAGFNRLVARFRRTIM